ncbi:MAG: hypothetical protein GX675_07635 [Erysipelotrichaceae bacterium]|nr:hypothetical protein [Erysipelotrichaceae bacterium]
MITFKPSLLKILFNLSVGILGIITLKLIISAFFNEILVYLIVTILLLLYLYFYAYRDIYNIKIDKERIIISRYNKMLYNFKINESDFEFSDINKKGRIKMRTLCITNNDKIIYLDLELFALEDFIALKEELNKRTT